MQFTKRTKLDRTYSDRRRRRRRRIEREKERERDRERDLGQWCLTLFSTHTLFEIRKIILMFEFAQYTNAIIRFSFYLDL